MQDEKKFNLKDRKVLILAILLLVVAVISLVVTLVKVPAQPDGPPVGPPLSPIHTPTPPRERAITLETLSDEGPPTALLITGTVGSQYHTPAFAVYAAADEECAEKPIITDSRPEGHNSLQVLPRLGPDDYDAAQEFFGFQMLDNHGCSAAKPGDWYWDIGELFLECGANNIHPVVHDQYGERITDRGILLFLGWPGAPEFSVQVDPPYNVQVFGANIGVGSFTRTGPGGGDVAWAYGGESHIGQDGGPYLVFASSDPPEWGTTLDWSDGFNKVGWWDDHCEFSPYFFLTQKAGTPSPTEGYDLALYDTDGNLLGIIPFQTGDPPLGSFILGLRSYGDDLGFVPWQDVTVE